MKEIFFKKKYYLFLLYIPLVFIIISSILIFTKKNLVLFPNSNFSFISYTDNKDINGLGKSEIKEFKSYQDHITMTYILKEGAKYPYAGIRLINIRNKSFDIHKFDYFKIKIDSLKASSLKFYILLYINNYSNEDNFLSFLYLQREIPIWQKKDDYILKIKDFYIPEWWRIINKMNENDSRIKINFKRVFNIQIESENNFPINLEDIITIKQLTLLKDRKMSILISCMILLIYYFVILISLLLIRYRNIIKERINKIIIPYKYLELESYIDEETNKILEYFGKNYKEPDLTVKKASYDCGISSYKIPLILKKRFKLTFPQYLNAMRLKEAERLLKETDIPVTDIAFNIGYNNISYFNYIFKNIKKISPLEFRNDYKNEK